MQAPFLTIASATAALRRGEVVAYPTETFYGLGAVPTDEEALQKVVRLKARDEGKPISLILGRPEVLSSMACVLTPPIVKLISVAWPGPLTVVLSARGTVHPLITAGTGTIAVRVPSHAQARILADAAGGAITATSANRQGAPPPVDADGVRAQFPSGLAGIVGGSSTVGGAPTTLVRPEGRQLFVLRKGVISVETLRQWWSGDVVPPSVPSAFQPGT